MITNGKPIVKDTNVVGHFSELAHDVVELAELQAKLLSLDAASAWERIRVGVVLVIVGACVLLGSLPVVLLSLAEALAEYALWPRTAALAAAGGIGLVAAGVILGLAWYRLKTMMAAFRRSQEELSQNVAWLKTSLRRQRPTGFRPRAGIDLPS
jgi:hypothetical protein